jgi:hypothetical protein
MLSRLAGFAESFTRPTWARALLLLAGAVLVPGKRTVTATLRIFGRDQKHDFPAYHAVLNRAAWSSRAVAGHRECQIICVSGAEGPILEKKGFHDDDNQAGTIGRTAGWGFES